MGPNIFWIRLCFIFNRSWHISTTPNTTKKKIVRVQTNTVVFYGHPELSGEEKSKFEFEEKKFSIVLKMEVCGLKTHDLLITLSTWIFLNQKFTVLRFCLHFQKLANNHARWIINLVRFLSLHSL